MEKTNDGMDLRINRWKIYREQIKNEARTYEKIANENKVIANIEKKIANIDQKILENPDSTSKIIEIPFKKSDTLESIDKDLNKIIKLINSETIDSISKKLSKDNVEILPQAAQDINNLEKLFENHKFPKNMKKIKKAVINIQEKHNLAKINLRENKNHITQIISNDINKNDSKKLINLVKNEKKFEAKIKSKKFRIITLLLFIFFLVLSFIFIGLWIGGI